MYLNRIPTSFFAATVATIFSLSLSTAAIAQSAPATLNKKPTQVAPLDKSAKEKLTDSSFVEKASSSGLTEVELSKIAVEKTTNKRIRKFAASMVKDHEAANADLRQVATNNRLTIATKMEPEQRKMVDELRSLAGADFDNAYVNIMKKYHDTTVALFDNAAGEPTLNVELRVFASKTLPSLRIHQKHAHALSNTITASR